MELEKYGMTLKTVDEDDSRFILDLRTNPFLSRHLSSTDNDLEKQKEWIRKYKERELDNKEFYFIAFRDDRVPLGLNRLYNFEGNTFEIGSWIYKPEIEMSLPVLGDFAARDFGFETLGFEFCKFEVRKDNKKVLKYHLQFNPYLVGEDDINVYYKLSYKKYQFHRDKLLKLLLK